MKSLALSLLLVAPLCADENSARLLFSDQSTISGTVLNIDPEQKTLKLTSPFLKGENTLKIDQLIDLQFQRDRKPLEADHYALATIMPRYDKRPQDDTIRGVLMGVDDEFITLNTWYAGELKLKRSMVKALNIYRNSPNLYYGPNSLDGWVTSGRKLEDDWKLKNRALISQSNNSIARKIEMGEKVKLSFKVAWKNSPYFRISFLANSGKDRYPGIGYTFHIQRGYVQLYRSAPQQQRGDLISQSTRSLRDQEKAHFEIYLDRRQEGKNGLFIDGKLIGQWDGTNDLKGMGDWLLFGPQNGNPIKISNISVAQWDGQLPSEQKETEDQDRENIFEGMEGQRIDLANGDALLGDITNINEGQATIKTSLGGMLVPVSLLSSFKLDLSNNEEPRMYGKDVRAWFVEGGFVTLRLNSLDEKKLRGYSQVFGDVEFELEAFSRIQFNVWQDLEGASASLDDW